MKFKKIVFIKEMHTKDEEIKTFSYPYFNENLKLVCKRVIKNLYNDSCIVKANSILYDYANNVLEIKIDAESTYSKHDDDGRVDILYNSIEILFNEMNGDYTGYNRRMIASYKLDKIGNVIITITVYIIQFITFLFKTTIFIINIPHMITYFIFGVLQMIYKDRYEKELKEKYKKYFENLPSYQNGMSYEKFKEKESITYSKYDLGIWFAPIELVILSIYITSVGVNVIPPIIIILLCAYIIIGHMYSYNFIFNFFKKHNLI